MTPLAALKLQWGQWLREGVIYFGIVGGSLVSYMLWNQLAFGTSTPVSGQIKRWWATFAHSIYGERSAQLAHVLCRQPLQRLQRLGSAYLTWLSDLTNRMLYCRAQGSGPPRWRHNFFLVLFIACVLVGLVLSLRRRRTVLGAVQTSLLPFFGGAVAANSGLQYSL